ncbi:alpha/beta fold hydrolase [Mycolicibacterium hodleri]|uniref:alpha/beta fold hydrolase n=1 Tax=Mycolicibacterium hodleri TaxID=49897 RepID=UPI0021F39C25|nr:alpha/beta hydrolase [Mycolicibacterium hodleri]
MCNILDTDSAGSIDADEVRLNLERARMTFRTFKTAMTAGVAVAALTVGCGGAYATQGAAKPTVVLVHGAFADSSSWNGVVRSLKADGYPVVAVANPLRGLVTDAEHVRSVVDGVRGPVVLAGHSYGGSVMSQAADGLPNVKALVYIASFILEAGESTAELAAKFPGGELGPALKTLPIPLSDGSEGSDLYIEQNQFRRVFAADVPEDVTALMAAAQRPITEAALEEPATKTAWKAVPSWNLVTTDDLAIPAEAMRFMGERAHSHTLEIKASHAVAVSQPDAVADFIIQAADSTLG